MPETASRQIDRIRASMDEAVRQHRAMLNRQLFASGDAVSVSVKLPVRSRWHRAYRAVVRYLSNWIEALGACRRAFIGEDAIRPCDCDDY